MAQVNNNWLDYLIAGFKEKPNPLANLQESKANLLAVVDPWKGRGVVEAPQTASQPTTMEELAGARAAMPAAAPAPAAPQPQAQPGPQTTVTTPEPPAVENKPALVQADGSQDTSAISGPYNTLLESMAKGAQPGQTGVQTGAPPYSFPETLANWIPASQGGHMGSNILNVLQQIAGTSNKPSILGEVGGLVRRGARSGAMGDAPAQEAYFRQLSGQDAQQRQTDTITDRQMELEMMQNALSSFDPTKQAQVMEMRDRALHNHGMMQIAQGESARKTQEGQERLQIDQGKLDVAKQRLELLMEQIQVRQQRGENVASLLNAVNNVLIMNPTLAQDPQYANILPQLLNQAGGGGAGPKQIQSSKGNKYLVEPAQ